MDINDIFMERLHGNGSLNFLLIHNAGGNRHFFTHQIDVLRKFGDVIWLDLPGHSKSKGLVGFQMDELSFILSQICEKLRLKNVCLVGLNNGANIVINTVLNYSLPINCLILIDPPLFMEKSFIAEINHFINELERDDYDKFVTSLVSDLFIATSNQNKAIATDAFNGVDKKGLQTIFKSLIEWDAQSIGKLKKISCPTLCILTDEHHCTYSKLKREAPHFEFGKVVGSKCWATLEVPEQVNAMIERFLMLNK